MSESGCVMKTIIIAAVCIGVASLSAIACSGGGSCGDKGEKGKDAPKESLTQPVK